MTNQPEQIVTKIDPEPVTFDILDAANRGPPAD